MQTQSKPKTNTPSRQMRVRANIVLSVLLIVGFLGLNVRLGYLQLVNGEYYQKRALSQQLSDTPIYAKRGSIYDRNGKALVQSATAYTVILSPNLIEDDDETQRALIADRLSAILDMDREEIYQKTCKDSQYEVIKRRIENDQAEQVRAFIDENKISSLTLADDNKRYYPQGNIASQVLGFTGTDNQGLYGIEKYYDQYLTGVNGRVVAARNAVGDDMPDSYETYIEAQDGYDLYLTIDYTIQSLLEKYLEKIYTEYQVKQSVTGIIMDVNTGEILAMSSKPDFDLEDPFTVSDAQALLRLEEYTAGTEEYSTALANERERMWQNKAITMTYEPGSTFKTLVAASALEEGLVTLDEHFNCSGSITVADRRIRCTKTHGSEDFVHALMNSCNPVFVTMGLRLGTDTFREYFEAFGLMEKTGIDLPGEQKSVYHDESAFGEVELAISSFGQTFKVTPIQMITAVAAATNGGTLVQPHLVRQMVDADGNVVKSYGTTEKRQVISEEVSQQLCQMMEQVVETGTAKNAYVAGYRVAGKTGTSEKTETRNPETGRIEEVVASMVAVAPADNPQVAILILADEPGVSMRSGGTVAGPAISGILSEILPYLGVEPVFSEEEQANMDVSVPDLTGGTVEEAEKRLKRLNLKVDIRGDGENVISQIPKKGSEMPKNGTVILYTDSDAEIKQATVPKLIGLTPAEATRALNNAGLNIKFNGISSGSGTLKVYEQSVQQGEKVDEGTIITVSVRAEASTE